MTTKSYKIVSLKTPSKTYTVTVTVKTYDTDSNENNVDKTYANSKNKFMHITNGNISTRLLQVNKSNSDWSTKQDELLMTIEYKKLT